MRETGYSSKGRGSSAEGACAFPWAPCLYAPSSAKHRRGREEKVYVPFQRIRVPPLVTPSRSVTARSPRPGGHTLRGRSSAAASLAAHPSSLARLSSFAVVSPSFSLVPSSTPNLACDAHDVTTTRCMEPNRENATWTHDLSSRVARYLFHRESTDAVAISFAKPRVPRSSR